MLAGRGGEGRGDHSAGGDSSQLTAQERDLELVAQEQVLDHEVVALMEQGGQGGEQDAEWLKHSRRIADRAGWSFAPLQAAVPALRAAQLDNTDGAVGVGDVGGQLPLKANKTRLRDRSQLPDWRDPARTASTTMVT